MFRVTSRRFCTDFKSEKSDPLYPSGRRDIPSGRSTVQASSVWMMRTFCPDLPLCQLPFELFQLTSVLTSQQHVWTLFTVRQVERFLSKTQIWKDSCNRSNDVCSHPDAILGKARRAYKVQPSGRQSSWSERSSLNMEIVQLKCDGPDARTTPSGRGSIEERISSEFGKPIAQLSIQTPSATVRMPPR
jgi:hypothetical protein